MSSATIEQQPTLNTKMSLYQADDEKHGLPCNRPGACHHRHGHNSRKLRMLLIFSLCLVTLGICTYLFLTFMDVSYDGFASSFWKRALGDGTSSDPNNQSGFVRNKLWIIVLVLGLFACLIAGIMLSAWCCRGAFENPLCCPCYLCACCGGLACLECISCGLCAELAEQ